MLAIAFDIQFLRISLHKPLGHQKAIVIFVTSVAIKFQSCIISIIDFQMESVRSHCAGLFLDKLNCLTTVTAAAASNSGR